MDRQSLAMCLPCANRTLAARKSVTPNPRHPYEYAYTADDEVSSVCNHEYARGFVSTDIRYVDQREGWRNLLEQISKISEFGSA